MKVRKNLLRKFVIEIWCYDPQNDNLTLVVYMTLKFCEWMLRRERIKGLI